MSDLYNRLAREHQHEWNPFESVDRCSCGADFEWNPSIPYEDPIKPRYYQHHLHVLFEEAIREQIAREINVNRLSRNIGRRYEDGIVEGLVIAARIARGETHD